MEEAAAIAVVAVVVVPKAAVAAAAVAVKSNASQGLVSPSAGCTVAAIRGTQQQWPREVRRRWQIRQSRFWPRMYPQPEESGGTQ